MSALTHLIEALDEGHREFSIAMENFPEEDLWKRPHPRLLSVGELAAHVAYGQAIWFFGTDPKPDLDTLPIKSPLLNSGFRYYITNVETPVQVDLTSGQILEELIRIHDAAKVVVADKDGSEPHPYWQTWGNLVQYQAFHVAYHTGQVYSARHLLGHETEDN